MGFGIEDDFWDKILHRVHTSSLCARHGLIQCKILHRTHWTKLKLSRIYPNVTSDCDRCHQSPANSIHMFWSCPCLQSYWSQIFSSLSAVLQVPLDPDPLLALFGTHSKTLNLSRLKSDFAAFLTLLARRRILMCWKSPSPPQFEAWLRDVLHFSKLDKIKFTLRGASDKFIKTWQPFFDYLQTLQFRNIPS